MTKDARARDWSRFLFLLPLIAVVLALFPDVALGRRFLFERDIHVYGLPQWEVVTRSLADGSWPLWDPTIAFGRPLLAIPSVQILYPSTWLHFVMRPWTQYGVSTLGHLLLTGVGLYRLARRYGLSSAGATCAACLWVASGPLLSLVNLWHHFDASAWIPWVLLAAESALDSGRAASALLWGAAVAIQALAGSADVVIFTTVLVGASAARRLDRTAWASAKNRQLVSTTLLAAICAAGLCAAQWMPSVEVLRRAALATRDPLAAPVWSIHPAALLQFLLPISFRGLPNHGDMNAMADLFDLWSPLLVSYHLGLGSVALVAVALAARRRPHQLFLSGVGLLALLFALGRATPVQAIVARIPPFTLIRYPSKATILVALAWSLLAGIGFDAWTEARHSWKRWLPVALMTTAWAAAVLATATARAGRGLWPLAGGPASGAGLWTDVFLESRWELALSTLLGGVVLIALLWRGLRRPVGAQRVLVAAAAVAEIAILHRSLNPTVGPEFFTSRPAILDVLKGGDPAPRLYVFDYAVRVLNHEHAATKGMIATMLDVPTNWPRPLSEALAMQSYLYPPSGGRWGLRGSYDTDPLGLYPRDLYDMTLALRGLEETPAFLRLLQLGGVDYVVALHTEGLAGVLDRVAVVPGLYRRPINVFHVPGRLPQAYAVAGSRVGLGATAFRMLVDPGFDANSEVVLAEGSPRPLSAAFSGKVGVVERRSDRVVLQAEMSDAGYVVLLDGYDPGWKATVDGVPTRVLPANLIFRAVAVPAGNHRVAMVYRPGAVLVGLAVSAVALVVVGVVLLKSRAAS